MRVLSLRRVVSLITVLSLHLFTNMQCFWGIHVNVRKNSRLGLKIDLLYFNKFVISDHDRDRDR
jgi:hypothetical protein